MGASLSCMLTSTNSKHSSPGRRLGAWQPQLIRGSPEVRTDIGHCSYMVLSYVSGEPYTAVGNDEVILAQAGSEDVPSLSLAAFSVLYADTSLWWRRVSSQHRVSRAATVLRCVRCPNVAEDPPASCTEACRRVSHPATVVEVVQIAPTGQELWCLHEACLESLTTFASPAELASHEACHISKYSDDAAAQRLSEAHKAQSEDLLLRVEFNTAAPEDVKTVFIYSHGFPDASVVADAFAVVATEKSGAQPEDDTDNDRLYASAVPRKWGDGLLNNTSAAAFVCFNTRGVPGSGGDFYTKTLTGDIDDLELARSYCASRFENASRLFLCGMSTGAFLSVAEAARPTVESPRAVGASVVETEVRKNVRPRQKLRLRGVFVLACVDDIPSSVSLDFSEEQRQRAKANGWCYTPFWPWSRPQTRSAEENNENVAPPDKLPAEPEQWRLGRGYLDSYQQLPPTTTLRHSLRVPLLLIHGDRDTHVPLGHSQRLLQTLSATSKPLASDGVGAAAPAAAIDATYGLKPSPGVKDVSLTVLKGGNHFLSSSKAMKQSLAAIRAFVREHSL